MVSNESLYNEFLLKSTEDCRDRIEYVKLYNVTHATKAYNQAIQKARNNLIVCVHQDVKLFDNFVDCLESCLAKLSKWGICGLAGATYLGKLVSAGDKIITKVMTIDDLCIILDRRNPLRFDEAFKWWHFYGEDIALQANEMGLGTYILPCRFLHRPTPSDESWKAMPDIGGYSLARQKLRQKWNKKVGRIFTTIGTH